MARGGFGAATLSGVALAVVLSAVPAGAQEPLVLDAVALDSVTAGGAKKVSAAGITVKGLLPPPSQGLAGLASKFVGRQQPAVVTPPVRSTGNGKKIVTASGKKSFKADRVTKPHSEILVVRGSASG